MATRAILDGLNSSRTKQSTDSPGASASDTGLESGAVNTKIGGIDKSKLPDGIDLNKLTFSELAERDDIDLSHDISPTEQLQRMDEAKNGDGTVDVDLLYWEKVDNSKYSAHDDEVRVYYRTPSGDVVYDKYDWPEMPDESYKFVQFIRHSTPYTIATAGEINDAFDAIRVPAQVNNGDWSLHIPENQAEGDGCDVLNSEGWPKRTWALTIFLRARQSVFLPVTMLSWFLIWLDLEDRLGPSKKRPKNLLVGSVVGVLGTIVAATVAWLSVKSLEPGEVVILALTIMSIYCIFAGVEYIAYTEPKMRES